MKLSEMREKARQIEDIRRSIYADQEPARYTDIGGRIRVTCEVEMWGDEVKPKFYVSGPSLSGMTSDELYRLAKVREAWEAWVAGTADEPPGVVNPELPPKGGTP